MIAERRVGSRVKQRCTGLLNLFALGAMVVLVSTGVTLASHHTCSCSITSPAHSCSESRTCSESNYAICSCTSSGCSSSCSTSPPSPPPIPRESATAGLGPVGSFTSFRLTDANLEAVKTHLEMFGWKVVVAAGLDQRMTAAYEDIAVEELVSILADEFAVCSTINSDSGLIQFLPKSSCGRRR